jgi:glyoxylase-like metal-dependent hydrolase (beta-lactamase superfamily II)
MAYVIYREAVTMSDVVPFTIEALELGPMENFVYLIQDRASGRAAVVDPAWDVPAVIDLARQRDVRITDILLTHSHHDHINGIESVLDEFDAQVHLLKSEAEFWGNYLDIPTLHHGGDEIVMGDTRIEVLHTPGHTPGSACYHVGDNLITGDTMFVFGCGRCDLSGGDPEQMFSTLRRLGTDLEGGTVILPGHNYAEKTTSTMGEQCEGNPFMHFDQCDDFVHYRMHYHGKHRDTPYGPVALGEAMPDSDRS